MNTSELNKSYLQLSMDRQQDSTEMYVTAVAKSQQKTETTSIEEYEEIATVIDQSNPSTSALNENINCNDNIYIMLPIPRLQQKRWKIVFLSIIIGILSCVTVASVVLCKSYCYQDANQKNIVNSTQTAETPVLLYTDLINKTYYVEKYINYRGWVRKLHMINNHIWCVLVDLIVIYDREFQIIENINHETHPALRKIRSFTPIEGGIFVLVACARSNGLHIVSTLGEYIGKVHNGTFDVDDVTFYNSRIYMIYATESSEIKLMVLETSPSDNYTVTNVIKMTLDHTLVGGDHKILVTAVGIYLSSDLPGFGGRVYLFHLQDGKQIYAAGNHSEEMYSGPGELNGPFLCGVDAVGNVLVADSRNGRMQVCDTDLKWHVINLNDTFTRNMHLYALLDHDGKKLWVATSIYLIVYAQEDN